MFGKSASIMSWLLICVIFGEFQPISVSAQQASGLNDAVVEPGAVVSFTFSDGITTPSDYFYWVKYNPFITIYTSTDQQPSDTTKYSVANSTTNSFVLTVNAVTVADADTYCFFSSKTKQNSCGNLVVIESVEGYIYPSSGLSVGQTVNLTCEVEYGGPTTDENNMKPLSQEQRPQLFMYIGNTQITNLPPGQDIIGSDQMTHSKSVSINRTILSSDVGQSLICTVTTNQPRFNMSSSTFMEVISPTTYASVNFIINATTNPGGTCCRVNDTLNCTADGYPFPTFVWTTTNGLTLMPWKSGNGYSTLLITKEGTFTVVCSAKNNMSSAWRNDTITFNSLTGPQNGSASIVNKGDNVGLGVGIGVGVGVPVLIGIIVLAVLLSRRKKAKPITVKQPEKKTPVGQTGNAPVKNGKGPEPGSRNNVNPNPNPTYYTPVMPEQTSTAAPKNNVRDSPGYGDLGVRHLGGSGSNPHLNESFDSQADKSFESSRSNRQSGNLQFTGGKTNPSPSAPNTSV